MQLPHFSCSNRAHRDNRTHRMGSHPAFAAGYTKGRCQETGQTLQMALSALSGPLCAAQHVGFGLLGLEWPLLPVWYETFAYAAKVGLVRILPVRDPRREGRVSQIRAPGRGSASSLFC
jgi:hypothetical protein